VTVTGQQVTAAICVYLSAYEAAVPSTWGAAEDYARRGGIRVQASPSPGGPTIDPWPFAGLCWQEVQVLRAFYTPDPPAKDVIGFDQGTQQRIEKARRPFDHEVAKALGVTTTQVRRIHALAWNKVRDALEQAEATNERNHLRKCE
jgi:hypothetical protein